jgi:uncharacterized membrane protein YhaH (DUF805 family)
MKFNWTAGAGRYRYRPVSIALMLASCLALMGVFVGVPDWLCFLAAAALYFALVAITYRHLRDARFSGAWVLLMIFQIGIGPTWHLSGSLTVNFGGYIIGCVPVILGWIAPANFGANSRFKSA